MQVKKTGKFDAAHKVVGHNGKCKNLHGHTFKYEVVIEDNCPIYRDADDIDNGMLIDFSKIKNTIGKFVDDYWDHGAILNPCDPLTGYVTTKLWKMGIGNRIYCNPTSENLAKELYTISRYLLSTESFIDISSVTIWETDTCSATFSYEDFRGLCNYNYGYERSIIDKFLKLESKLKLDSNLKKELR